MKAIKFIAKETAGLLAFMIGTTAVTIFLDNKAKEVHANEESR